MNRLPAIDRYIARLIFFPMLGTLVLSAMLLVLEKMLRLFDFVATEGGPVSVVWRMLANLIPEYLSLGIPIGLMLGILLAFRRLATSSERFATMEGRRPSTSRARRRRANDFKSHPGATPRSPRVVCGRCACSGRTGSRPRPRGSRRARTGSGRF